MTLHPLYLLVRLYPLAKLTQKSTSSVWRALEVLCILQVTVRNSSYSCSTSGKHDICLERLMCLDQTITDCQWLRWRVWNQEIHFLHRRRFLESGLLRLDSDQNQTFRDSLQSRYQTFKDQKSDIINSYIRQQDSQWVTVVGMQKHGTKAKSVVVQLRSNAELGKWLWSTNTGSSEKLRSRDLGDNDRSSKPVSITMRRARRIRQEYL